MDPDRRDRDGLLRAWLVDHGVDPDATDSTRDLARGAALGSGFALARDATLSARDLAQRSGTDLDQVVAVLRHLGVAVHGLDAVQFTQVDATLVRAAGRAAELGLGEADALLRVVGGAVERMAEAAIAVYAQGPSEEALRRSTTVLDCVRADVEATELALQLGWGLGAVFRHHMRQAVTRQLAFQEDVSRRELARVAVGFVDLVGSTAMQARLDPAELAAQVSRFEARAFDVIAAGGGRLVKFIGDEIMVASIDPAAGVRIVDHLVRAFTEDGTQPRAGIVYGEVLFRHGDYYGPVVNLAARLADAAIPGEALVDRSVLEALENDDVLRFEPAGRRMLKGFSDPVEVWSLAMGR
jgi:adenylate cyclase